MVNHKKGLCLLIISFTLVNGAELPGGSVDQQPRAIFVTIPTLQQKAALYFIKRLINDSSYADIFMELPISEQLKDITLVSSLLNCLIDLSNDTLYKKRDVLKSSFSKNFFASLKKQIDESSSEEKKENLKNQMSTFVCVRENGEKILRSFYLTHLFILALNDPTIQIKLGSGFLHAGYFLNTLFDLLLIKNYSYVFDELSTDKELRNLLTKRLITIFTDEEVFENLSKFFINELENRNFYEIVYESLKKLLIILTYEELVENNNELAQYIIEPLILLTSPDDLDAKELLDILFEKKVTPNILVVMEEDMPATPLASLLFFAASNNEDQDLAEMQLNQIKYLVEHGLDLSSVQEITETNDPIIKLAHNYYNQLKKTNPQFITELESAHYEINAKKNEKQNLARRFWKNK